MSLIGRSDFFQFRTTALHNVRKPVTATNFDQLTTRDNDFLVFRDRRQYQHGRRRIVIHHGRRFGAC